MCTEKLDQERPVSTFKVDMAFEQINRPKNFAFDRTTTEEHEKRKHEIADNIATELIANLSPEDRFDVFNNVRSRLENVLKSQVEEREKGKIGVPTDLVTETGTKCLLKTGRFGSYLESENFKEDQIRISLGIKTKIEL